MNLMMKYFVLNPNKKDIYGEASRRAINEYARTIQKKNPKFAEELMAWTLGIRVKQVWK